MARRYSLRTFLVTLTVGSTVLASGLSLAVYNAVMTEDFKRKAAEKTEFVADRLAANASEALWNFSLRHCQALADAELADQDINGIVIRGVYGDAVASAFRSGTGADKLDDPFTSSASRSISFRGEEIGTAVVYADMKGSRAVYNQGLAYVAALAAAVAIFTAAVLFFGTDRAVARRVRSLARAMEDFARNRRAEPLRAAGARELAALADAFNSMADTISRYGEGLEREVRDRTEKLMDAEKLAALAEFTAALAHELNTPLGNCVTSVSFASAALGGIAEDYRAGTMNEAAFLRRLAESREALEIAEKNLAKAGGFVSTLKLTTQGGDDGQVRPTRVADFLRDAVAGMKPALRRYDVNVRANCRAGVIADIRPGALYQVVANLVMNGLYHGFDEGGRGTISLQARPVDGGLELVYEDDGRGLPENLGLALVKYALARDGGSAESRGRDGGGTAVRVFLPCRIEEKDETGE